MRNRSLIRKLFYSASFFLVFVYSCQDLIQTKNEKSTSIEKGKRLAENYCQSCHILPEPAWLDSQSWSKGVLPHMGPFLGIFNHDFLEYPSYKNDTDLVKNFYPPVPLLSSAEWQNIIDYYVNLSPGSLPEQQRQKPIHQNIPGFAVEYPGGKYLSPALSFIKIDTLSQSHPILVYDIVLKKILWYNRQYKIDDSLIINTPVTDAEIGAKNMVICNIGIMNPNNGKFGSIENINVSGNEKGNTVPLIEKLSRPVSFHSADLNKDGKTDFLVNEFGHLTGELSWFENNGNNSFQKHILREKPGAIAAVIDDYNRDGLPDIWALFSQGDEGIYLFTNMGNNQFSQKAILRFPPVQGSTYFELDDFNKDGYKDILYTCGDNSDFSPVLKPYHGVYIFLNNGNNQFTQKYFFPINGCFKAMAKDFDKDGDLDIAAISFFADYSRQPGEGFVYLENTGNFNFEPYSFPESASGRWLTMDVGDIDGDKKEDIILGNFSVRPSLFTSRSDWKKGPPFIVLKNKTR